MKAAIAVFLKGTFMMFVGLLLAAHGLPSDETDASISAGTIAIDALNSTSNSPHVSDVAASTKESFAILGFGSMAVGLLEWFLSLVLAIKYLS